MKKLLPFLLLFFSIPAFAAINNITEQDGSPSVYPWKLKVTNGTLTDNGDGSASLVTGGGGGSTSIGGAITNGTDGSVLFVDPIAIISQDNANFFYDALNHRLGIGTSAPGVPLDVRGIIQARGFLEMDAVGGTFGGYFGNGNALLTSGASGTNDLAARSANAFGVSVANSVTPTFTILNTGNVGIGNTSPNTTLEVRGTSFEQSRISKIQISNDSGMSSRFYGGAAGTTLKGMYGITETGTPGNETFFTGELSDAFAIRSAGAIQLGLNTSPTMTLDISRDVGIGTSPTLPTARLVISADAVGVTDLFNAISKDSSSVFMVSKNKEVGINQSNPTALEHIFASGAVGTPTNLVLEKTTADNTDNGGWGLGMGHMKVDSGGTGPWFDLWLYTGARWAFGLSSTGNWVFRAVNSGADPINTSNLIVIDQTGTFTTGIWNAGAVTSSGAINGTSFVTSGKMTTYNNVATTNWGVPASYGTVKPADGQTGAATLSSYTNGAADASFWVSANINVTTATTHNFTVTCTYTDETNTSRVLTLPFTQLTGSTLLTAITNITGTGPYESPTFHIRCKASTSITIATTGTFTSVVYNGSAMISQIV